MFVIKVKGENQSYYLTKNATFVVGRLNRGIAEGVDIVFSDVSISRKHAEITYNDKGVVVKDLKSKYSTKVNNVKIEDETVVQAGSEIQVGLSVVLQIEMVRIKTSTSGMESDRKEKLNVMLGKYGLEITNSWDESCTHLTVDTLLATVKVLQALLDNKPIVTSDYWNKVLKSIKNKSQAPNPDDFFPNSSEQYLNKECFKYNPDRNKVFQYKILMTHTEKDKSKLSSLIEKAGGKCVSFEKSKITLKTFKDNIENIIVIKSTTESSQNFAKNLVEYYESIGKMQIPLNEVILAIINCNCSRYCNPNFQRKEEVFASTSKEPGRVIVEETANIMDKSCVKTQTERVIPETMQDTLLEVTRNIDELVVLNPIKKLKLDNEVQNIIEVSDEEDNKLTLKTEKSVILEPKHIKKRKIVENKAKDVKIENPFTSFATTSKGSASNPFMQVASNIKEENKRKDIFDDNPFDTFDGKYVSKKIKLEDNPFIQNRSEISESAKPDNFLNEFDSKLDIKEETDHVSETKEYSIKRTNKSYEIKDLPLDEKASIFLNSLSEATRKNVIYVPDLIVVKNVPIRTLPNGKKVCADPKTFKKQEYLPGEVVYSCDRFQVWNDKLKDSLNVSAKKVRWQLAAF